MKGLTEGPPFRLMLSFLWPILLGNLFQQMYNLTDSMIIGRLLGVEALAALGATGSLSFLVIGFAMGICAGICIPIAQRFGAGELDEMRRCTANAVYTAAGTAGILTVLVMAGTSWLLRAMNTPADIFEQAYDYIIVIFGGIWATMLYNLLANIARALGDSRTPLYFLILASLLNIVLDLGFILGLGMGVAGAAWATVLAQAVSGGLCILYMRRAFPILRMRPEDLRPDPRLILRLLGMGVPMALQSSITAVGSIILQSAVNSFGSRVIASVTAAGRVHALLNQPIDAMGITMANYCGQNLGARRVDRIQDGVRKMLIASTGFTLAMWAVSVFAGPTVSLLFIDGKDADILENIASFLWANGMFTWLLGSLTLLRSSVQGMGFSLPAMLAGVFELAARALVAFCFVGRFGYSAICYANPVAWVFANMLLIPVYLRVIRLLRQRMPCKQTGGLQPVASESGIN